MRAYPFDVVYAHPIGYVAKPTQRDIDRALADPEQGESRAQYGQRLLENLSREFSASFGKGFSYANLRNFRQFYLTYPDQEICYTLCCKLSWSQNRLIMRVEDPKARAYYLQETAAQQWSVRQLEHNIKSQSFQRWRTPVIKSLTIFYTEN